MKETVTVGVVKDIEGTEMNEAVTVGAVLQEIGVDFVSLPEKEKENEIINTTDSMKPK